MASHGKVRTAEGCRTGVERDDSQLRLAVEDCDRASGNACARLRRDARGECYVLTERYLRGGSHHGSGGRDFRWR